MQSCHSEPHSPHLADLWCMTVSNLSDLHVKPHTDIADLLWKQHQTHWPGWDTLCYTVSVSAVQNLHECWGSDILRRDMQSTQSHENQKPIKASLSSWARWNPSGLSLLTNPLSLSLHPHPTTPGYQGNACVPLVQIFKITAPWLATTPGSSWSSKNGAVTMEQCCCATSVYTLRWIIFNQVITFKIFHMLQLLKQNHLCFIFIYIYIIIIYQVS